MSVNAGTLSGTQVVSFTALVPSGGTPAYTYQWHKSQTAGFTPVVGTRIGGGTSSSLSDTPAPGVWYYTCVVTDSLAATGQTAYTSFAGVPAVASGTVAVALGNSSHGANPTVAHFTAGYVLTFTQDLTKVAGGTFPSDLNKAKSVIIKIQNAAGTTVSADPATVAANGQSVSYTMNGTELLAAGTYRVWFEALFEAGSTYTSQPDTLVAT